MMHSIVTALRNGVGALQDEFGAETNILQAMAKTMRVATIRTVLTA